MTETYLYKLNMCSHKVFEQLFFKFSPIMRRSGKWNDTDLVIQSELYSNEAFASASVEEIRNELEISDVLMQDVCEYMEQYKHIDVTERLTTGIIKKIRATKLGFKAYKFESYLQKNETLVYQHKFKQSAFWNNILTPTIALVALVYAVAGYYKKPDLSVQLKMPQELVSPIQEQHINTILDSQIRPKIDSTSSSVDTANQHPQHK